MLFAQEALKMRQLIGLPPFAAQALFRATAKEESKAVKFLEELRACFTQIINAQQLQGVNMLIFNAPMLKKAGYYRHLLLLQHPQRAVIQQLLKQFEPYKEAFLRNDIRFSLDVDPQELG